MSPNEKALYNNRKVNPLKNVMGPLLAFVAIFVFFAFASEYFLGINNLLNILKQSSIGILAAMGMLFILLTGGVDLSLGSIVGLSVASMNVLHRAGADAAWMLIVPILVGVGCGLLNGVIFTALDLPHPFVSTLGTMTIYRGIGLLITNSSAVTSFPSSVIFLGKNTINGFPISFILAIAIVIICSIILGKTVFGRSVYAVGSNKEAARLSGISIKKILNSVYAICGLMSALAAIVLVGRVDTAYQLAGEGYEMDAIAACVIGGASFLGGKGFATGALIGAVFMAVLQNGLNLLGAEASVQKIVVGIVVIAAVFIDVARGKVTERAQRLAQAKAE